MAPTGHSIARHLAGIGLLLLAPGVVRAQLTTSQYDNARSGATTGETQLSPETVTTRLGKLFTLRVEGDVYAQPLYLTRVAVPDRTRDLLFVVTENDDIYAFDAKQFSATPVWHVALADAARGITPIPSRDVQCPFIKPAIGISATPVIDSIAGTLFVLARTREMDGGATHYVQRLHAVDVRTGAERPGSPVVISATVSGRGAGSTGTSVTFDALRENPRAALLLDHGRVYLSWASSCDVGPYHGWVMAYDARTLAQVAVFNTSPDGTEAGVWQGQAGLSADEAGNVYAVTGNGTFDAAGGGSDYGDTILKLGVVGNAMVVKDYFTPHDEKAWTAADLDFGSGGAVLLSRRTPTSPNLVVAGSKAGVFYIVDRDRMGHFEAVVGSAESHKVAGMVMGAPAYWNGHLYYFCSDDALRDYVVQAGNPVLRLAAVGTIKFSDPGATPVVSSNGATNGIVWVVETKGWSASDRPAVLHAFAAADVTRELYSSERNATRDRAGLALRFAMPTVVDGRVYVAAKGEIDVYGLIGPDRVP